MRKETHQATQGAVQQASECMGLECRERKALETRIWSQCVDDIERLDETREKRIKDCSLDNSHFGKGGKQ